MKYGRVDGAVETKGFQKWIELNSFAWGCSRNIDIPTGGAATREMSTPTVKNVTVTKRLDRSTPNLMLEALAGTHESQVSIAFTTTEKGGVGPYLTYKLWECALTGYDIDTRGSDALLETLVINFAKIECKYVEHNAQGKADATLAVGYDLAAMRRI